ncbi:unnamed protein product [Allacma fusca]|uniref:Uncharacterized protein n=1 Tax=Allacma fusca TaxID=39272 RepID=A0A8J2LNB2_9HEXA|nr:unnamed protein product [Allacma fusca]
MVGNCGCVADLDWAPINLAGVVRPGHRCGRFQEVSCDQEVPASEGSGGWVIGIGAGVVDVGLFGCLWYRYRHTLVDFVRDRVAQLQGVSDAARALWRAILGPRAPR